MAIRKPEDELLKWQQQYQQTAAAKPADYVSQYAPMMQEAMSQYTNQKPFAYDVNADALYQQMKDRYIQGGQMAMKDTMGQASALTGGYGNTYAQTAGQQQYNQYLQGLNDNIPALQDRAYQRYQDEGSKYLNQFNLAGQMEQFDYGKYRDTFGDWQNQRAFDYGGMQDAQGQANYQQQFDYGKYRDTVGDTQWQTQFDYGKQRDTVADSQWGAQFDWQKQMDTVQTNFQNAQFEWQKATDARDYQTAEYWKNQQMEYQKEMDALSQQNWESEFGFQQEQFQYGKDMDAQARADALAAQAAAAAGSGGSGGSGGTGGSTGGAVRASDKAKAVDAYINGGVAALDAVMRKVEMDGVSAAELWKLRQSIIAKTNPLDRGGVNINPNSGGR